MPTISMLTVNVILAGGLWPFGDGESPAQPATIEQLSPRKLELKAEPVMPAQNSAAAREQYRLFLEISNEHPELRREAMRRLADLSLDAGEEQQISSGSTDSGFYRESIALYRLLLEKNPGHHDADRVLYQLARAYESTGQNESALVTLNQLVDDFPASQYYGEAQFRRGEVFFVGRYYADAEPAYRAVITLGQASPFYQQSLYKHGWAQFKQGHNEQGLDSFLTLLDLRLAGTPNVGALIDNMPRPQREIIDDTLRVLAISFSYLDGPASIDASLSMRGTVAYADLLYASLGDLYIDQERYIDAAKAYAAFVDSYPQNSGSPEMQVRVITAYTQGKFPSLVLEAKQRYVELYGLDTGFWVVHDVAEYPEVVARLKDSLSDLAEYDHASAQTDGDQQAYQRAAGWYRRYLDYFPADAESARRSFLLAEILFELQRFDEATDQYLDAAYAYGAHSDAAEAGYAALLAAREHEKALTGAQLNQWRSAYTVHALKFADQFPQHEQAAAVRTKVAEELFAAGKLEQAVQIAGLVVTMQPPADGELERTAWTVVAHAQFELQEYGLAEQAYRRLRMMPPGGDMTGSEIDSRIAASIFRQAEVLQAAGNVNGAVAQYLRVAEAMPDSDIVPTAMYDAATLLINDGQWLPAIGVLQNFRARYPNHASSADVTQKLAVAQQSAGNKELAAVEYERIARLDGVDTQTHREALWLAADLYADSARLDDEARVYRDIVTRFAEPFNESIEARQRLADLAKDVGDWPQRQRWLESIIEADKLAQQRRTPRSRTLAARAELELAELPRDAFLSVPLTAPLKESLKLKRQRMEMALNAYGRAAAYEIAEVTTAATFEIGELYYRLSQDLMSSQRPEELNAEELEQYEILLEEQAYPFEEQAIEIFDANASRAAAGVYDEWVRSSYARLALLMPARYAKTERSENRVANLY